MTLDHPTTIPADIPFAAASAASSAKVEAWAAKFAVTVVATATSGFIVSSLVDIQLFVLESLTGGHSG